MVVQRCPDEILGVANVLQPPPQILGVATPLIPRELSQCSFPVEWIWRKSLISYK
jgi:hypothetical protein